MNQMLEQNRQYLEDSTFEMNKTRDEIRKLKLLQQHNDSGIEQFKKENDILKSELDYIKTCFKENDDAINKNVDARIKEFKVSFFIRTFRTICNWYKFFSL